MKDREADVIEGFATDASILEYKLQGLEDDEHFFLPYEAAPLVHAETLKDHPELEGILNQLAGKITTDDMRKLNYQVEFRKRQREVVAREFLEREGLILPNTTPGNGSAGSVTIGSKNFTENEILGEIMAIWIEHSSNIKVVRELNRGGTATNFYALLGREIDLYAEYTGTGLNLLGLATRDFSRVRDTVFETVRREFKDAYDLVWLEPFGFNNPWTLLMRSVQAKELGIKRISDLAEHVKSQGPILPGPPPPKGKAALTPAVYLLRSLQMRGQPAQEAGPRSIGGEERFLAQFELVDGLLHSEEELKRLSQASEELKESYARVYKARLRAVEPTLRVIDEKERLNEHRQSIALAERMDTPVEEILLDRYLLVAMSEAQLRRVEELKSAWQNALGEYDRHQMFLTQFPNDKKVGGADLKTFSDHKRNTLRQIETIRKLPDMAADEHEHLKKEREEATSALEQLEKDLEPKWKPREEVTSYLPPGAPVDEIRREVNRLEGEAQAIEKEALAAEDKVKVSIRYEALAQAYVRHLKKLLEEDGDQWAPGDEENPTEKDRNGILADKLKRTQTSLSQRERWVREAGVQARMKRDRAGEARKATNEAEARLHKEEARARNARIFSFAMAAILAAITIAGATVVQRLVRTKALWSVRGVTDPEKRKRIHTPYLLIRRIAVPLICFVGGLMILMQFETFRNIGMTILASAGLVSLVVGLSARNLLGNAMAGLTLCFSQPIRVGDTVKIGDEYGTIEDIELLNTTFRAWDNRRLVIPNEEILSRKEMVNYTLRDQKIWTKVAIYLDYAADMKKARSILIDVVKNSKYWNGHDEPQIWLMELGEETVTLWVAAWADDPAKAWELQCDVRDNALERFKEEGIPLPPRRFQYKAADVMRKSGKSV